LLALRAFLNSALFIRSNLIEVAFKSENFARIYFDLAELREELIASQGGEDSETYREHIAPALDRLEARYGNRVPVAEIEGIRQIANAQIADIRQHRQEIIDHAAKEGKTIDTASLRQTMEEIKAKNTGPDRDAIAADIDRLLQSLEAKYGAEIPIDHAQRIVEDLEAGREVSG
jgi:hypothetical protein